MKICKKCLINKEFTEFNKRSDSKDGFSHECRECSKIRGKKYYINNENKIKKYQKEYYKNNEQYILYRVKNYRQENIDSIREYDNLRREDRKDYLNEYTKIRRQNDVLFRLSCNLRNRTRKFLKNKSKSTKEIIGIEPNELRLYLESKFVDGMNWNNYGYWHIDHIIPLSSAKNENELVKLCHYTNLQPLFAKDNIIKSNKIYNGITKKS
jgi:hypothetical protein